jgi:hypothetical protein
MSNRLQTFLTQHSVTERQASKRLGVSGPRSGYILFSRDERQNHDSMGMSELSKIIGERWRSLDDSERSRYQQLAVEDRQRFHTELLAAFEALNGADLPELRPKRVPKKITVARQLGVKGALTAYIYFSMDVKEKLRRKYPDAPMTDIVRKTAEQWKRLSASKRAKYERMAEKDKARYQRELQEGFEQHPNIRNEVLEANAVLFGRKLRKRRNTYGVKNALSAYIIYSTEVRNSVRQANPDLSMTEVSKVIAQQWNALDDTERATYNQKALADKERFRREFEEAKARAEANNASTDTQNDTTTENNDTTTTSNTTSRRTSSKSSQRRRVARRHTGSSSDRRTKRGQQTQEASA